MTREETIKLAVKSLLEVVQTGAKNIEINVQESYGKMTVRFLSIGVVEHRCAYNFSCRFSTYPK